MHTPTSTSHDDLERMARRRAGAKLGWYLHACVYVLVNLFLAYLSSRHSAGWAIFPALGWGLGLLIHGAAVWIALPDGSLYGQLLARERASLRRRSPH
jgi:hypothetical protein